MRRVVALVIVIACGDDAGTPPDAPVGGDGAIDAPPEDVIVHTSGSRLRARYVQGAQGERSFAGWHDTELDLDCLWTFGDEPRCWPSHYPTIQFADAACTEPVYQHYSFACPELPTHISTYGDCAMPDAIYTRGAAYVPTMLYARTQNGCEVNTVDGSSTYYRTTPDATAYAQGSLVTRGPGRVQTRAVAGPDGSLEPQRAYDTTLASTCFPILGTGDPSADVCRPDSNGTIFSAASDCSSPIAFVDRTCTPRPYTYLNPVGLFRVGEEYTGDPAALEIHRLSGGQCTPVDRGVSDTEKVYLAGDLVPTTEQVPVARVRDEASPNRLQPYFLAADQYRQPTGNFYDAQLASDCELEQFGANEWRCVPPSNPVARDFFFTDADCNTPIAAITGYTSSLYAIDFGSDCDEISAGVYMRGAELGTLYTTNSGSCMPYPETGTPNYGLGPAVPLDMFAELTAVTE